MRAAFPCRAVNNGDATTSQNVEMDAESEFEVRTVIQNSNMQVVGWYHSHPTFMPEPSIRDIKNQDSYQRLFGAGMVDGAEGDDSDGGGASSSSRGGGTRGETRLVRSGEEVEEVASTWPCRFWELS